MIPKTQLDSSERAETFSFRQLTECLRLRSHLIQTDGFVLNVDAEGLNVRRVKCVLEARGEKHSRVVYTAHPETPTSDHETGWISNAASALWHAHTCPHAHPVARYHSPRRHAGDLRRRAGDLQALHAFTGFVFLISRLNKCSTCSSLSFYSSVFHHSASHRP